MTVKPSTESASPADELDEPESTRGKLALGRYQVATIPTDIQVELANLRRPLLSDEALKAPPPINQVARPSPASASVAPVTDNTVNRGAGARRLWTYVGAGVALVLVGVGWAIGHFMNPPAVAAQPSTVPSHTVPAAAPVAVAPSATVAASSSCAPPPAPKVTASKPSRVVDKPRAEAPSTRTANSTYVKPLIDPIFKAE